MIEVNIYQKKNLSNVDKGSFLDTLICEVEIKGHAGYDENGSDIVCSAVSILVLNTINAVEAFTDIPFGVDIEDIEGGYLLFSIEEEHISNYDAQLLLKTMILGLSGVQEEYSEHIKIIIQEV